MGWKEVDERLRMLYGACPQAAIDLDYLSSREYHSESSKISPPVDEVIRIL